MRLKPKTVRRLTVLALGLLVVGLAAGGVLGLGRWQTGRLIARHRQEGLAAVDAGDHLTAVQRLGWYLNRRPKDAEALRAYAAARQEVEEPDGSHLPGAIRALERYLSLVPDDSDEAQELVRLYLQAGYFPEARDLAHRLRPASLDRTGPEHAPLLRAEAQARLALNEIAEAGAIADRLNALARPTLEDRLLKLDALLRQGVADRVRSWTRELVAQSQDDPAAELVANLAELALDGAAARSRVVAELCRLAGVDRQRAEPIDGSRVHDAALTAQLVRALDGLGLHDHALSVLARAARQVPDVALQRVTVRRLWQAGRLDEVLELSADLDAGAHAELWAFRALALWELGRSDEAAAIGRRLGARRGDYRAEAWSMVLAGLTSGSSDAVATVASLRAALEVHPREPVLLAMLGDALAVLGRAGEAREAWAQASASPVAVGWARPMVRIAESLRQEGRVLEAVDAADAAVRIAPRNVSATLVWLDAHAARLAAGFAQGPDADALLAVLSSRRAELAQMDAASGTTLSQRMVPIEVSLLISQGQPARAAAVIREALASGAVMSERTLLELAGQSRRAELGLEEEILARAELLHGQTVALLEARAAMYVQQGMSQRAEAMLHAGLVRARDEHEARTWRVALARWLDLTGQPAAHEAWAELTARYPDDLEVHRLALVSPALARDAVLVERVAARYEQLAGLSPGTALATTTMARARALLGDAPTARQRDEAVALLSELIARDPAQVAPRLVLAEALLLDDPARGLQRDVRGAIRQLEAVLVQAPRAASVALHLAGLYQQQREFGRARAWLERVGGDRSSAPEVRYQAASMLLSQGDAAAARAVLAELVEAQGDSVPSSWLAALAEAHLRLGDRQRGAAVLTRLASRRLEEPAMIVAVAAGLERVGQVELGQQVAGQLAALDLSAAEVAVHRAAIAEAADRRDDAVAELERAVAADPMNVEAWEALARLQLAGGRPAAAVSVAVRAVEALPDEPRAAVLLERMRLAVTGGVAELDRLMAAMAAEGTAGGELEVLRAMRDAHERGLLDDAGALEQLAERFRGKLAVQLFVASRLAALDPPQLERATAVGQRAMQDFPAEEAPARLVAQLLLQQGRWEELLATARAWRARAWGGSVEADLAAAQALLRLHRPEEAWAALEAHVASASEALSDEVSLGVINIAAQALVGAGRVRQAEQWLEPLLSGSAVVRARTWLGIAASQLADPSQAWSWIERAGSMMSPTAVEERLALAAAWSTLGARFEPLRERAQQRAIAVLAAMVEDPDTALPEVYEALGKAYHAAGRLAEAERAYRAAIAGAPDAHASLNNLAHLELERGAAEAALELAQRAVEASPRPNAAYLDTLARVQLAVGDRDGAIATLRRAMSVAPDRAVVAVGLAAVLAQGTEAERAEAEQLLAEVARRWPDLAGLPADVRARWHAVREALGAAR